MLHLTNSSQQSVSRNYIYPHFQMKKQVYGSQVADQDSQLVIVELFRRLTPEPN